MSSPPVYSEIRVAQSLVFLSNFVDKEEFEDSKGVIRIRISKKNRQHNGLKEKVQKGKQNIHIKLIIE